MADEPEKDDKTEEPTAKRIEDARKKGDVIYSQEATAWLMLAAGALIVSLSAGPMAQTLARSLIAYLEQPHVVSIEGASLLAIMADLGMKSLLALGLAALALAATGVLARYLQDQPAFSAHRLKPELSRINPIEGAKRVFGKAAMANFLKGLAKLVIVGAAVVIALWPRDGVYEVAALLDPAAFLAVAQARVLELLGACLAAFALIAGIDYFTTRQSYIERLRMTREELKREFREQEGDPHLKAKLRQIRIERSKQRMMQKVPDATVVVTNPTHYSIALKYDRETAPTPVCLAKGVDDVALKIREVAQEHRIPLIEDPPLARALYASAELDQPIPREHYEAVAKVIGLVLRLAQRRRPRRPNR